MEVTTEEPRPSAKRRNYLLPTPQHRSGRRRSTGGAQRRGEREWRGEHIVRDHHADRLSFRPGAVRDADGGQRFGSVIQERRERLISQRSGVIGTSASPGTRCSLTQSVTRTWHPLRLLGPAPPCPTRPPIPPSTLLLVGLAHFFLFECLSYFYKVVVWLRAASLSVFRPHRCSTRPPAHPRTHAGARTHAHAHNLTFTRTRTHILICLTPHSRSIWHDASIVLRPIRLVESCGLQAMQGKDRQGRAPNWHHHAGTLRLRHDCVAPP